MEADAERIGGLARRHQQFGDLVGLGAELRGEAELRMIGRHAKPDQQVQILRAFGRADDLFELVERVEREGAYAMLPDRRRVVSGQWGTVRVDRGGGRTIK